MKDEKLTIDKKRGDVAFNERAHKYFSERQPEKEYISVTTLLSKFEKEFDEEFWSAYKALEALVEKGIWITAKRNLLEEKKVNDETLRVLQVDKEAFLNKQEEIKKSWIKENEDSKERGTKIHAMLENYFYEHKNEVKLDKYGVGGVFECRNEDVGEGNAVYPEYLIYYSDQKGEVNIAGQIDLLVIEGNEFIIMDWKTNKKIDEKSYFNKWTKKSEKLMYPLNDLDACNFSIYNMQLSTYAYMVEKAYPELICKGLRLVHFDHEGHMKAYEMKYLKKHVEKVLLWWKKENALEKKREKRKHINY